MNDTNQIDRRIETALERLRDAEPRPGMEQRILTALRDAEQEPRTSGRPWMSWQAVSLAAGLMVMLAFAVFWHAQPRAPHVAQSASLTPNVPEGIDTSGAEDGNGPAHKVSALGAKRTASAETKHLTLTAANVEHAQMAAAAHTAEQSFPAPPLPLTEQERLLLRLVRRNSPVQLAQLTMSARDASLLREQEEVTSFFADPTPLVQGQP